MSPGYKAPDAPGYKDELQCAIFPFSTTILLSTVSEEFCAHGVLPKPTCEYHYCQHNNYMGLHRSYCSARLPHYLLFPSQRRRCPSTLGLHYHRHYYPRPRRYRPRYTMGDRPDLVYSLDLLHRPFICASLHLDGFCSRQDSHLDPAYPRY